MKKKIVGFSGSPRNKLGSRWSNEILDDLKRIPNRDFLMTYLQLLSNRKNLDSPHDKSNKNDLNKLNIHRIKDKIHGISNSEIALIAALWAARKRNVDFDYVSLREHFSSSGKEVAIDILKEKAMTADAILFSGPVYFGDRSSLIQFLINTLKNDPTLLKKSQGRFYGGISTGAKRNGGQETSLIYQILDMISLGFIAVGNDSDTTAQYGGTCVAGGIGSILSDENGINTAMGVGRRLSNLISIGAHEAELTDKPKILFLVLQDDQNGSGVKSVEKLLKECRLDIDGTILDVTRKHFLQCLACDVCPDKIDRDEVYRCKLGKSDDFFETHEKLMGYDAIVPVAVSMKDFTLTRTNYQIFLERTRYLRRGDYFFTDMLVAPFIIQEIGSTENMHIRMITSFIRHHTLISKPIIAYRNDGRIINNSDILSDFRTFVTNTRGITAGRLADALNGGNSTLYNPVGYVVNPIKIDKEKSLAERRMMLEERNRRLQESAKARIKLY